MADAEVPGKRCVLCFGVFDPAALYYMPAENAEYTPPEWLPSTFLAICEDCVLDIASLRDDPNDRAINAIVQRVVDVMMKKEEGGR